METNYKYFIRNTTGYFEEIDFFKSLKYPYNQIYRVELNNSLEIKTIQNNNFNYFLSKIKELHIHNSTDSNDLFLNRDNPHLGEERTLAPPNPHLGEQRTLAPPPPILRPPTHHTPKTSLKDRLRSSGTFNKQRLVHSYFTSFHQI